MGGGEDVGERLIFFDMERGNNGGCGNCAVYAFNLIRRRRRDKNKSFNLAEGVQMTSFYYA